MLNRNYFLEGVISLWQRSWFTGKYDDSSSMSHHWCHQPKCLITALDSGLFIIHIGFNSKVKSASHDNVAGGLSISI